MPEAVLPPSAMQGVEPPRTSLKDRVLRAGGWTLGGHAAAQLLRLGGNLVMTRLLVPEMFGVMAIAYVFMTALAMFSDTGIAQNIVQSRRGAEPAFLNTAWTVQVLRGAVICVVTLLLALVLALAGGAGWLPLGTVYADPALPPVLAALAVTAVIAGFESTRLLQAKRQLELARITRIDLACSAITLLVMVVWAWFDRTIWALVAGGLVGALSRTLLSHFALPGANDRWAWEPAALTEIFGFGKWVFLSSILGFLVMNADRLILGGLVDAEVLGVYSIAVTLVAALEGVLTKIVGDVALPAFSEIARERPDRLRATFYRFHGLIGAASLITAGALLTGGGTVVRLLYDDRYLAAGWMLGIVAVGLLTAPARVATQCFLARGESRVIGVLTLVRLPAVYVITPLAFHQFGLAGALWAISLSALCCLPIVWFYQARAGLLDFWREAAIWPALPLGLLIGLAIESIGHRLAG